MGNNINWKPFLGSVQIIGDTFYYATVKGINLIEVKDNKANIVFSEENDKIWGAFYFSIVFQDMIVFTPYRLSYIYVYNPKGKNGWKIEIPAREKEEKLLPYLSKDSLILFGTRTCRTYIINSDWNIEILEDNIKATQWEAWRSNNSKYYIDLWNDKEHKIGYIDRNTYCLNELTVSCDEIYASITNDDKVYVLTTQGELMIYDIKTNKQTVTLKVDEAGKIQKMILYDGWLYFLPGVGKVIKAVSIDDLGNTFQISIEILSGNMNVFWTDLKDGELIGMQEDKSISSKENIKIFTYNLISKTYKIINLKKMFWEYCLFDKKEGGHMVEECADFGLQDMLNRMLIDNNLS